MAKTPHETEKQLADDYLTGAVQARELSRLAMNQAIREAEAGTLRDPAKTAMNAAITSGTLLDKRLLLQSRPTQITAHTDPKQDGLALARALGIQIESTAEEIPEAQLIEAKPKHASSAGSASKRAREREPGARSNDAVD